MASIRTVRASDGNFTNLSNELLQDVKISSRARGIAVFMMSFPPNWRFTYRDLSKRLQEGESAIRASLKELQARGYLKRSKSRGEGGTWVWESVLADSRLFVQVEPCGENQLMD